MNLYNGYQPLNDNDDFVDRVRVLPDFSCSQHRRIKSD
jgi:hypothetical protein